MSYSSDFYVLTGNYTSLRATFRFERRMGFYLIQVYLPTLIITILSWLSFYIDPRDIGERVSLGTFHILGFLFIFLSLFAWSVIHDL